MIFRYIKFYYLSSSVGDYYFSTIYSNLAKITQYPVLLKVCCKEFGAPLRVEMNLYKISILFIEIMSKATSDVDSNDTNESKRTTLRQLTLTQMPSIFPFLSPTRKVQMNLMEDIDEVQSLQAGNINFNQLTQNTQNSEELESSEDGEEKSQCLLSQTEGDTEQCIEDDIQKKEGSLMHNSIGPRKRVKQEVGHEGETITVIDITQTQQEQVTVKSEVESKTPNCNKTKLQRRKSNRIVTPEGSDITVSLGGDTDKQITITKPWYEQNFQKNKLLCNSVEKSWLYVTCKRPKRKYYDETIIPVFGCHDYMFTSKRYIQKEHKVLMGRIHVWAEQTLEMLGTFECREPTIPKVKFEDQRKFAEEFIPKLLQELEQFDFCVVSMLQKQYLYRLIECCDSVEKTTFIFKMANSKDYYLVAKPDKDNFEVATVFDRAHCTEYGFGKPEEEKVVYRRSRV